LLNTDAHVFPFPEPFDGVTNVFIMSPGYGFGSSYRCFEYFWMRWRWRITTKYDLFKSKSIGGTEETSDVESRSNIVEYDRYRKFFKSMEFLQIGSLQFIQLQFSHCTLHFPV